MDLFLLILSSLVFVETSALCVKSFSKKEQKPGKNARRKVFVDTSTLMDGRILSIARTGFLGDEILITRSVVRELQLLADGADAEKRTRARFGLDIVNELKSLEGLNVTIYPDELGHVKVDERLLELAKSEKAFIMTNDYNLIKVATTDSVEALNINELAQSMRSEYLPGDKIDVKVVGVGSNPHQGVAYLADGTMVVIDGADKLAGKNETTRVEFVRYLQTSAGKMMFARLDNSMPPKQNKASGRKRVIREKAKQYKNNKKSKK